jgi:hypothetical protein
VELSDAAMRELARDETVRNDADDFAAGGQRRVGDHTHQTNVATAVDDADAAACQLRSQCARGVGECRTETYVGAAENAQTHREIVASGGVRRFRCCIGCATDPAFGTGGIQWFEAPSYRDFRATWLPGELVAEAVHGEDELWDA